MKTKAMIRVCRRQPTDLYAIYMDIICNLYGICRAMITIIAPAQDKADRTLLYIATKYSLGMSE